MPWFSPRLFHEISLLDVRSFKCRIWGLQPLWKKTFLIGVFIMAFPGIFATRCQKL